MFLCVIVIIHSGGWHQLQLRETTAGVTEGPKVAHKEFYFCLVAFEKTSRNNFIYLAPIWIEPASNKRPLDVAVVSKFLKLFYFLFFFVKDFENAIMGCWQPESLPRTCATPVNKNLAGKI